MTSSDADAIAASLRDPSAFVVVFDRHFEAIRRYVARRLGADLAADLAAETFTRAFHARRRYDQSRRDALPWLYGIAANVVRRELRNDERRARAYARVAADRGSAVSDGDATLLTVGAALAALTPDERDVLLLHAWEELSYDEIALALRVPVGTVRSRLNRARRRAAEALDPTHANRRPKEPIDG